MIRKLLVVGYYLALAYYFVAVRPSVFIMLFSLWCEMVLILLLFAFFSVRTRSSEQINKMVNVLIGALPLLIIECAVAFFVCGSLLGEFNDVPGQWPERLFAMRSALLPMGISLLLIYTLKAYDFVITQQSMEVIEGGIRFQAALLTILGFAVITCAGVGGPEHRMLIIVALCVVRFSMEPILDRLRSQ